MIAKAIAGLGLSDPAAKAVIVIVLTAVSGILAAIFPDKAVIPPLVAALVALAALIDPNANHPTT